MVQTTGVPPVAQPAAGTASDREPVAPTLAGLLRALADERDDLQAQLIRSEKLAGIGRLAAGVAHEIRNPLGALSTYVEVLRMRGAEAELAASMREAIDRIERTVQSLLHYARPGGRSDGPVDAGAAVTTAIEFLRAQGIFKEHPVSVHVAEGLPAVRADRHELEQVIVNLVCNACDAGAAGIWVGATARAYEPGHREARRRGEPVPPPRRSAGPRPRRPELEPGTPGVFIYVADDGPGVPEADRERIFDPFFTTKEPGKGTGLGLAIVARTVESAGGLVWVDRAREGGAAFKLFLPAADGACAV